MSYYQDDYYRCSICKSAFSVDRARNLDECPSCKALFTLHIVFAD